MAFKINYFNAFDFNNVVFLFKKNQNKGRNIVISIGNNFCDNFRQNNFITSKR